VRLKTAGVSLYSPRTLCLRVVISLESYSISNLSFYLDYIGWTLSPRLIVTRLLILVTYLTIVILTNRTVDFHYC
jgi:hypothetical protein